MQTHQNAPYPRCPMEAGGQARHKGEGCGPPRGAPKGRPLVGAAFRGVMTHLPARLGWGGRVRSKRRTAGPHPSLLPPLQGLRWQRRRRPSPAPTRPIGRWPSRTPWDPHLGPVPMPRSPDTRRPLQPSGSRHPTPRSHVRPGTPPNSSKLRQNDVTCRTPGSNRHEPRASPVSRVPPATALTAEDHGG